MREAPESRQADRQALQGGHVRLTRGAWGRVAEPVPLLDEASTHYPKKKGNKARPKKEHCSRNPNGHTHEWMKDEEPIPVIETKMVEDTFPRWNNEERKVEWIRSTFPKYVEVGTKPVIFKLCVHCGKTVYKHKGWRGRHKWSERPPRHFNRYKSWNGHTVIH